MLAAGIAMAFATKSNRRRLGCRGCVACGFLLIIPLGWPVLATIHAGRGWENARPPWHQAVDAMIRRSDYWAGTVISTVTTLDDAGRMVGRVVTREELDLTSGRPVWGQSSRLTEGQPGGMTAMDFGLRLRPGLTLVGYEVWSLRGQERLDGKPVEVWSGIATANPEDTVTVYVEKISARPRRMVFTVPFSRMLGQTTIRLTVDYGETAGGAWLPSRAATALSPPGAPRHQQILIEHEYLDWRPGLPPS
jgi:hypothetical protein